MDAFSVAICKGLATRRLLPKHYIIIGLWFGGFQALMPAIGYFLAGNFGDYLQDYAHIVACILLCLLGANMMREGLKKDDEETSDGFGAKSMIGLALATSVDALAVGVTFALLPEIQIVPAISAIGIITFGLSALGLKIGHVFGRKYQSKAQIFGGVVLIVMGFQILLWPTNTPRKH